MRKNRLLTGFLLVSIIILTLAGCKKANVTASPTENPSPTVTATNTPTATLSPTPTATPTPTKTPREELLGDMEKVSGGDLYRTEYKSDESPLDPNKDYYFYKVNDGLMVVNCLYSRFHEKPVIVSPDGRAKLIPSDFVPIFNGYVDVSVDGTPYTVNLETYVFTIYDLNFTQQKQFSVADYVGYGCEEFYFDTSACEVIGIGKSRKIFAYNYETDTVVETVIPDEAGNAFDISEYDGKYITVACTSSEPDEQLTYFYNLSTHSFEEGTRSFYRCSVSPDGTEFFADFRGSYIRVGLYDEKTGEFISNIRLSSAYEIYNAFLDWENRCYITYSVETFGQNPCYELRCYSIDTGTVLSTAIVPKVKYGITKPCLYDDLGVLCLFGSDKKDGDTENTGFIYYWDYLSENIADFDEFYKRQGYIPGNLKALADSIEKKYGIYIYLGYDILSSDFDYELKVCDDNDLMYTTLQMISEELAKYPGNFFKQLKTGSVRSLGIYLCDGMTAENPDAAANVIGLASSVGYERSIALDCNYGNMIRQTVHHEISHLIDSFIIEQTNFGFCQNYLANWEKRNPEGFGYLNNFNYYYETQYIYFYESDPNNVYFIDSYATTNANEDRARLYEYLLAEDGNDFYKCPHLIDKLTYRFDAIREAFDTTGWPETTFWEEKLEEWKTRAAAGTD